MVLVGTRDKSHGAVGLETDMVVLAQAGNLVTCRSGVSRDGVWLGEPHRG
jgi:hypothetical protein